MKQDFSKLDALLSSYEKNKGSLITLLQAAQQIEGYLSRPVLKRISEKMKVPAAEIFGVVTFYSMFRLEPKGKHFMKMCDGTACHVRGSTKVIDAIRERLNLTPEQITTDDMMYTFETVSCLGACGLAPVLVVDDIIYGEISPQQAMDILDKIDAAEMAND